jgi:predicted adenine nucleotide alpha hydrolase (AANH) superfamily ATPase
LKKDTPPLLLHLCCGPCAVHVIDLLRNDYHLIGLFFNPNIHPEEEFSERLRAAAVVCRNSGTALWAPGYHPGAWMTAVRGREGDREGGRRCEICFRVRMEATAAFARRASIPVFATTLSISPHKNSNVINDIGRDLSEKYQVEFLPENFKKKNGFQESVRKSKELDLYRQNYCGCSFSR